MNQYATRLLVALLTVSLLLPLAACGNETTAATMRLKRTEGDVAVSDDTGKDVPLLESLSLYSGYGVDTRPESYAWIDLDDVKLTKMDQESVIAIQKEGKALDIKVISGSLFFNITQPLEKDESMDIRTSTMLIGIRGTCGWAEDRDGVSRVYLLEGAVECSAGGQTVQVNAGEMAELTVDGNLKVEPFTVRDIPAFVQNELLRDPGLCSDIYGASGLDILGTAGGEEASGSSEGASNEETSQMTSLDTFVPWPEAGLEDHVMDWKDENLEDAMRNITGIYERDIMLSDVWELTELEFRLLEISDISALSGLTNLKKLLLISAYSPFSDISPLGSLINLKSLVLISPQVSDISILSGLTNLEILYLESNRINDISPLSSLTNLELLDLHSLQLSDISPLSSLTNLTSLDIGSNYGPCQISDITPLSGLTNLTSLDLHSTQVSDISALSGLTNLTELNLSLNQISDFSSLCSMTNLEILDLSYNQISDIGALRSMTNLKNLDLYNNQISDISALSGLTNLTRLSLSENQISDISALRSMTDLESLGLDYNQVSDINALSGLTKLTKLSLTANQVSDISVLSGLTNLTDLWLASNQISDIRPLSGLKNLTFLWLSNNPIEDYSSVEFIEQNGGTLQK